MSKNLDYKLKRLEKGPLQRFKNQNAVLKKFGEPGIRLYKAASGKKTAEELVEELGLEPDFVAEVAAWLEERGMAELITVEGEEEERPSRKKAEEEEEEERPKPKKKAAEEEEEEEEKPKPAKKPVKKISPEPPPEEPEEEEIRIPKPKSRLRDLVEQELGEKEEKEEKEEPAEIPRFKFKKEKEIEPEPEEKEEPKEEEKEAEPEEKKEEEEITPIGEISPVEEETPAEPEEKEGEKEEKEERSAASEEAISPVEEEKSEPAEEPEPKKEEIAPELPEEEKAAESEPEEKPPAEEEKIEPESDEDREKGEAEAAIAPESGAAEEGSDLNPVEKTIREKYGEVGLKVYALIDGQKTAEEIMNDTGISEAKLIEMLEFMEKQGIIKLEHPEQKAAAEATESKDKFAPLEEAEPGGQVKETSPVELPTKVKMNIFTEIQLKTKIALQFGEKGSKVVEAIDGKNTDVDLSLMFRIPLYEVRDLLSFLSANRIITVRTLDRTEVAKKYGEDCFAIYKKYGREGVLLYELIGKDLGIRQIFQVVTKEKDKFAEMFIFVHKVLGIDLPIDKDVIYAQLEGKK